MKNVCTYTTVYIYAIFVSELMAGTRLLFIMNTNKKFIISLICRQCNSAMQHNSMQSRQILFALIVLNEVLIVRTVSLKIVQNNIQKYSWLYQYLHLVLPLTCPNYDSRITNESIEQVSVEYCNKHNPQCESIVWDWHYSCQSNWK